MSKYLLFFLLSMLLVFGTLLAKDDLENEFTELDARIEELINILEQEIGMTPEFLRTQSGLTVDPNEIDFEISSGGIPYVEYHFPTLSNSEKKKLPIARVNISDAVTLYESLTGKAPRAVLVKQTSRWCAPCWSWDERYLDANSDQFLSSLTVDGDVLLIKVFVWNFDLGDALTVPFTFDTEVMDWYKGLELIIGSYSTILRVGSTPSVSYHVIREETGTTLQNLDRIRKNQNLNSGAFQINISNRNQIDNFINQYRPQTSSVPEIVCKGDVCEVIGPQENSTALEAPLALHYFDLSTPDGENLRVSLERRSDATMRNLTWEETDKAFRLYITFRKSGPGSGSYMYYCNGPENVLSRLKDHGLSQEDLPTLIKDALW